jgi:DnaJ-class molecular chaperone
MKQIKMYKEIFEVEGPLVLKDLKTKYRNLVKEWHPDKFQDEVKKEEAGIKSSEIIDAYHYLVSIAPETKAAGLEEYKALIEAHKIADFKHEKNVFEVTFTDGTIYEYFGVPEKLVSKFYNSDKQFRFAKRQIFHSFPYRKAKKEDLMA